jgi:phosphoglycerol transferase MdoB-like AlkP superfamily enzyme
MKKYLQYGLFLTLVMSSFRLAFFIYYGEMSLLSTHITHLAQAFFVGFRYDLMILSYIFVFPILLSIICSPFRSLALYNFSLKLKKTYFYFFTLVIVVLLGADFGFYSYFGDHLNPLFFGLVEDDTKAVIDSVIDNYPVFWFGLLIVLCLGLLWLPAKFTFNSLHRKQKSFFKGGALSYLSFSLLPLIIVVIGSRGGLNSYVLSPKYSDFSDDVFINVLSVNGIITLEKAIKERRTYNRADYNALEKYGYGKDYKKAFSDYLGLDVSYTKDSDLISLLERRTSTKELSKKYNVVVFVMESFGAFWMQYNDMNFNFMGSLNKHFKEDILFKKNVSSSNGTIGSILTIMTNLPFRSGAKNFSMSKYMNLPLSSSSNIPFQKHGYESTYLYGGKLSWRKLGSYAKIQGFNNIIGEGKIKKKYNLSKKDGTEWGLYDEYIFNYAFDQLSHEKPQFILALSTTNHPPFRIPTNFELPSLIPGEKLQGRIKREEDLFKRRFEAFNYANEKLAQFIQKVKDSKFKDNTIIAVTGDHNFWGSINYKTSESFVKYTVPLYFYLPNEIKPSSYDAYKVSGHEDIMTTIYNLTLSNTPYLTFGDDLFADTNSNGLNESVQADNLGSFYRDKFYSWKSKSYPGLEKDKEDLKVRYRSIMSVSDYYLRKSLEAK